MQEVSAAFTAEEKDTVRKITADLLVSWKKESNLGNRTFTIGVSLIGSNDLIGINPGAIGSPGNYSYFEESDYLLSAAWERSYNMPVGGLSKALAEAQLENTSGRFTPGYMGGESELFTSILPRRPFIINAGFDFAGIPQNIPQFAGILTRQPEVDSRRSHVRLVGADYVDFFYNRYTDQESMFTGFRTDEVYEQMLVGLGLSTGQYVLDTGINIIQFGIFDKGTRYSDLFHKLAEAEAGHFYQDEEGIFRFENRQHWDTSPSNQVQKLVLTGQVLEAEAPDDDHIINVVEVKSKAYQKQPIQTVFSLPSLSPIEIPAGETIEKFLEFQNPILELTHPTDGGALSYYVANTESDETGTDITSSVTITNRGTFARAVKYQITNSSTSTAYITQLTLAGRTVIAPSDIYVRSTDDSSLTAYEERPYYIENEYIQNADWANSLARMILNDYSEPDNLQRITIRAIPELQLGDLISWQGRYWRIFKIASELDPASGYIQRLTLLQRTPQPYFRIGISTIGSADQIAP